MKVTEDVVICVLAAIAAHEDGTGVKVGGRERDLIKEWTIDEVSARDYVADVARLADLTLTTWREAKASQ